MFHLLSFIFFFILILFVLGLVIIARVLRFLGFGKKQNRNFYQSVNDMSEERKENGSEKVSKRSVKKKVFDESEGEYIDFVDV